MTNSEYLNCAMLECSSLHIVTIYKEELEDVLQNAPDW